MRFQHTCKPIRLSAISLTLVFPTICVLATAGEIFKQWRAICVNHQSFIERAVRGILRSPDSLLITSRSSWHPSELQHLIIIAYTKMFFLGLRPRNEMISRLHLNSHSNFGDRFHFNEEAVCIQTCTLKSLVSGRRGFSPDQLCGRDDEASTSTLVSAIFTTHCGERGEFSNPVDFITQFPVSPCSSGLYPVM